MAVARVVSFDGVTKDRAAEIGQQMQSGERRPEGVPATEIMMLHDAATESAMVILLFAGDEDYRRGDEALNAMPAADTPGRRTAVTRYEVIARLTA